MTDQTATAYRFERESKDAVWSKLDPKRAVALGHAGLGWAWDQTKFAGDGEPTKKEGDGRTPAGIFSIGPAFGFAPEGPGKDYLPLKRNDAFCVDDVRSSLYNEIVPKVKAGAAVSGETMSTISLYRRGLRVNIPTNREQKGGSCIFIHVWRGPTSPTTGCVALSEPDVTELQIWAGEVPTVIAILPLSAVGRLQGCIPNL
jgi:L,D-peptidoglycan transpeptidase YkuD (ErfK/YbiS/YcfS/YnhG family)